MIKVIILYDLIAREYWMCNEIKKEIEKKGGRAFIFALNFEYNKAIRAAKNNKIDLLMIPSNYVKSDYERIVGPFKKIDNNTIPLCFHHEQITIKGKEADLLPTDQLNRNTMYHLSCGEYFTKLLVDVGVKENLIIETGSLRLQEVLTRDYIVSRDDLSKMYGLDKNKKWILYCDSATLLQYNFLVKGEYLDDSFHAADTFNETLHPYAQTFIETNKIFNGLSDEVFEQYELIYRPHPGNQTTDKKFLDRRIKIIRDHSVYTWFKHVEFNIVFQSSAIFESDCMGVKSFILMPVPLDLNVVGLEDYTNISTRQELESLLLGDNEIELKKGQYKKYIGDLNPKAFSDFVTKVFEIADSSCKGIENLPYRVNNKKIFTSILAYYIVVTLSKFRILKYVKWPENFNHNKYEHPMFRDKYAKVEK